MTDTPNTNNSLNDLDDLLNRENRELEGNLHININGEGTGNSGGAGGTTGTQGSGAPNEQGTPDGAGGSSGGNGSNGTGSGGTENSVNLPIDGVSRAYAMSPEEIAKAKRKETEKKGGGKTPPARDKGKIKSSGDKDICEVFWKHIIVASWDWFVNFVVDTGLDFVEFVLYPPTSNEIVSTTTEKDTALNIGQEVLNEENLKTKRDIHKSNLQYDEMITNIQKELRGEAVAWPHGAPPSYPKLKRLAQAAQADPTSQEAKTWGKLTEKDDDGVYKIIKASETQVDYLKNIAIKTATVVERVAEKEGKTEFSKKIEELKEIVSTKTEGALVRGLRDKATEMLSMVSDEEDANQKDVKKTINTFLQKLSTESDTKKLAKDFISDLNKANKDEIKNRSLSKQSIKTRAVGFATVISGNIAKIKERYKNDPQLLVEVMNGYTTEIKDAVDASLKLVKEDESTKKCKKSLLDIDKAINEFLLDGRPIKDCPLPSGAIQINSLDDVNVAQAFNEYKVNLR